MEKIKISTTQNVDIEYSLASVGDRMTATIIDWLMFLVYAFFVGFLLEGVIKPGTGIPALLLITIPILSYDLLCEIFMDGQSFGKKIMKIKVVKVDGVPPDIGSYLLRWVLRLVEVFTLLGSIAIITIIVRGKGQRIGDIAANTVVIKLREEAQIQDTVLTALNEDYKTVYPEVTRLTDKDITIINELIKTNRSKNPPDNIYSANMKAKKYLEERLGVQSNDSPMKFFMTLLKDYNNEMGRV